MIFVIPLLTLAGGALLTSTEKASSIEPLLAGLAGRRQFNGSVLIAAEGEVLFKQGFGTANFEWAMPNTPSTAFRLCSASKSFTATLITQLIERGRLSPDNGESICRRTRPIRIRLVDTARTDRAEFRRAHQCQPQR